MGRHHCLRDSTYVCHQPIHTTMEERVHETQHHGGEVRTHYHGGKGE